VEKAIPTIYTPSALEHAKIEKADGDGLIKAHNFGKKIRRGKGKGQSPGAAGGKRKVDPDQLLEMSDGEVSDSTSMASVSKRMRGMGAPPGSSSSTKPPWKLPTWGVRRYS
jgi:hypothetical protein